MESKALRYNANMSVINTLRAAIEGIIEGAIAGVILALLTVAAAIVGLIFYII
ncbi:hypothetical protein NitYY0826_C1520 [Nitratiruptor sp. YY08-26]|nr:hypothetical protein NitYY0813_C1518 [Nitratiruptor sp. YY08-13]BCD66574.1 hypothetical protein NitYY0826_C1520 [Nitratiruptor sp. YY08-26]